MWGLGEGRLRRERPGEYGRGCDGECITDMVKEECEGKKIADVVRRVRLHQTASCGFDCSGLTCTCNIA